MTPRGGGDSSVSASATWYMAGAYYGNPLDKPVTLIYEVRKEESSNAEAADGPDEPSGPLAWASASTSNTSHSAVTGSLRTPSPLSVNSIFGTISTIPWVETSLGSNLYSFNSYLFSNSMAASAHNESAFHLPANASAQVRWSLRTAQASRPN